MSENSPETAPEPVSKSEEMDAEHRLHNDMTAGVNVPVDTVNGVPVDEDNVDESATETVVEPEKPSWNG